MFEVWVVRVTCAVSGKVYIRAFESEEEARAYMLIWTGDTTPALYRGQGLIEVPTEGKKPCQNPAEQ